jgi:hypothetical protein
VYAVAVQDTVRQEDMIPFRHCPSFVQQVMSIMGAQMQMRFFTKPLKRYENLALALNPTLDVVRLLDVGKADLCLAALRAEYQRRLGKLTNNSQSTAVPVNPTGGQPKSKRPKMQRMAAQACSTIQAADVGSVAEDEITTLQALCQQSALIAPFISEGSLLTLHFWAAQKDRLPMLYKIARATYAVLPTEANIERAFSGSKIVLGELRTRTHPDSVRKRMVISLNRHLLPPVHEITKAYKAMMMNVDDDDDEDDDDEGLDGQ